jgi:hypothetical protein
MVCASWCCCIVSQSPAVSARLHAWIDLVFGCRQRGAAAVEAQNVFYHLTYEGAVDIEAIADPVMKAAAIEQIRSFGQTPGQVRVCLRMSVCALFSESCALLLS